METFKPKTYEELKSILSQFPTDGWTPYITFYRGQICDWQIRSGVARDTSLDLESVLSKEKTLFEEYKSDESLRVIIQDHFNKDKFKFAQEWFDLFQAQHLGLKTRLTDWSQETIHAMFFATDDSKKECIDKDGVIWVYVCPDEDIINFNEPEVLERLNENPFNLKQHYIVKQYTQFDDHFDKSLGAIRMFRQHGSFGVFPSDHLSKPLEEIKSIKPHLYKVCISPELKKEIAAELVSNFSQFLYAKNEIANAQKYIDLIDGFNAKHFPS